MTLQRHSGSDLSGRGREATEPKVRGSNPLGRVEESPAMAGLFRIRSRPKRREAGRWPASRYVWVLLAIDYQEVPLQPPPSGVQLRESTPVPVVFWIVKSVPDFDLAVSV